MTHNSCPLLPVGLILPFHILLFICHMVCFFWMFLTFFAHFVYAAQILQILFSDYILEDSYSYHISDFHLYNIQQVQNYRCFFYKYWYLPLNTNTKNYLMSYCGQLCCVSPKYLSLHNDNPPPSQSVPISFFWTYSHSFIYWYLCFCFTHGIKI